MKNYKIYKVFPSPVFHYEIEDYQKLNIELKNYILELKKNNKEGINKSNQGGWHSPNFDLVNAFMDISQCVHDSKSFLNLFILFVDKLLPIFFLLPTKVVFVGDSLVEVSWFEYVNGLLPCHYSPWFL